MSFKKSTPNATVVPRPLMTLDSLNAFTVTVALQSVWWKYILYGELGRYPADILIKSRMIGFWKILVCGKRDKISCILYNLMYKMHTRNFYFSKWLDCVLDTLNNCGFSEYWIHQNVPDNCYLAKMIKKKTPY